MKASYVLPSGTYNILLTKDELLRLLETGYVIANTLKDMPCVANRMAYNDVDGMHSVEKREVYNFLGFTISDKLADIDVGNHHIQFLTINIEKDAMSYVKDKLSR